MKFDLKQSIYKIKSSTNVRHGLLFAFFAFLNNGVNFLMLMLLANFLNPSSYGTLNLYNTTITILGALIHLGCAAYIGASFFKKKEEEFREIIRAVFSVTFVMFAILIFISICFKSYFENLLGFSINFQIIALLVCLLQIFTTVNLDIWRLQEKPITYGLYSLGFIALNFILTIIFTITLKMDWEGRVFAQLAAVATFFFISIAFLFKRNFISIEKIKISTFKEVLSFGVPLIPHTISSWLRQGLDRFILNYFWGATSVGLFSFAINFGNVIHLVGMAFNMSYSVYIYKNLAKDDDEFKYKLQKQIPLTISAFFIFSIVIFIAVYISIPYLFPKYIDSLPYLFPICLGGFFQCVYYLFANYLFFFKKTRNLMYITFSISAIHLLLSFFLTKYSPLFTAYISLFSNFAICVLVIIVSQKYYPIYKRK